MKNNKFLIVLSVFFFALATTTFAQDEEEMTVEQWEAEMNKLNAKKQSLQTEISTLEGDIENLNTMLSSMQTYEDCVNEVYALVGATKTDVDNYRRQVNELESKIKRQEGPKEERQKELNALKENKISALPEFFDKVHNQLQRMLNNWKVEDPTKEHTVVKGDCLWNIAKKKDYYGNPWAWKKIYQSNKDKIKNPDLIYPGQVFKIPPLTEDEKAHYDKLQKRFKTAPTH